MTSNVKLTTISSFASINTRCEAMDENALLRGLLSDNSGGAIELLIWVKNVINKVNSYSTKEK